MKNVNSDYYNMVSLMDISDKIQYWTELAEYDIIVAKDLLEKGRYLYVGFFCHLFVEKMLKGYFWFSKNSEPPYTHNLVKLADLSDINNQLSENQKKLLSTLMPLNIEARYPNDKELINKQLTENVIKEIFSNSLELKSWIQHLMK